jgi:3-hydroxymyristoyl/3-hydroxydecanoyl-(acyl carrier protein) dehydratase
MFPHAGIEHVPGPPGAPAGVQHYKVSARSRCFDGHFDGAPVLPAVAHVAVAVSACATRAGRPVVLTGLRELRVRRPLGPGDDVEVVLTVEADAANVAFDIRRRGEPVSAGVLVVVAAAGESLG